MQNSMRFSKDHIWIIPNGDTATIGITDYAQESLGSIMFLNLPEVGETLETGKRFGDIESIKTVTDLISPVSGSVIKVNEELLDEPDLINEKPYECWFLEIKVTSISEDLMDEKSYVTKIGNS